ncbi:hypothetical protein HMPREF1320_1271 [Capnocytophaga sp. oral taxon 335 str. F0486]|nr:hypothetical protein HMPREF1320_1271 [Capnocytophaga sp. oral taxon 335 str. F0486]
MALTKFKTSLILKPSSYHLKINLKAPFLRLSFALPSP